MRILRRIVPLALLPSVVLAGVSAVGAAPKGRVVVALATDTPTLDPHMHTARIGIIVGWHLYDTLYSRDPKTGRPIPSLAESLRGLSPTSWELKLRRNVRFHNGSRSTPTASDSASSAS